MRGIFAVDPGGHTGVAWSIVDETKRTAVEAMQARIKRGSATLEGDPMAQARALWQLWFSFKHECVTIGLMDPGKVDLVFEDFVLYGGEHAGGRDGTAPERITWAFEGYRHGRHDTHRRERHMTPISFQMASAASTFKTRRRLESCDAWVKGREHERSAYSHMILRLNVLMNQNLRKV